MKKVLLLWLFATITLTAFAQKKPPKDTLKTPLYILSEADDRAKKFLPQYAPLSPNASASQNLEIIKLIQPQVLPVFPSRYLPFRMVACQCLLP